MSEVRDRGIHFLGVFEVPNRLYKPFRTALDFVIETVFPRRTTPLGVTYKLASSTVMTRPHYNVDATIKAERDRGNEIKGKGIGGMMDNRWDAPAYIPQRSQGRSGRGLSR